MPHGTDVVRKICQEVTQTSMEEREHDVEGLQPFYLKYLLI